MRGGDEDLIHMQARDLNKKYMGPETVLPLLLVDILL
jgi:hypothetical protein